MRKIFFLIALNIFLFLPVLTFAKPINILIVPGHDNDSFGAGYKKTLEVDINRILAKKLTDILKKDKRLNVLNAHDGKNYSPFLLSYYESDWNNIIEWRQKKVSDYKNKTDNGHVAIVDHVPHASPPITIINRLYGINKWVSENNIDGVVHLHFNDYGSHPKQIAGEFTGFAVYTPESQAVNSSTSMALAQNVFNSLDSFLYRTNSGTEGALSSAPIEDQALIALGANETLPKTIKSILIEYSYIYESLVQKYFDTASSIFADATSRAIKKDFFGDKLETPFSYKWKNFLKKESKGGEVLALQFALKHLGYFPPSAKTRDDCPMTGNFGPCTEEAVKSFQKDNNFNQTGALGPKTRAKLNSLFP